MQIPVHWHTPAEANQVNLDDADLQRRNRHFAALTYGLHPRDELVITPIL